MKILVVTPHFYPEGFIINDIALELEKLGHEITVLTGKPHYPKGEYFDGYNTNKLQIEYYGQNVQVYRSWMLPRKKGRSYQLLLNYLTFVLGTCWVVLTKFRKHHFDVVFVFATSPITVVIPAILAKELNSKTKLVTWVQDIWPQALRATGHIKNRRVLNLIQKCVNVLYGQNDLLLGQSRGFVAQIQNQTPVPIVYYPNSFKAGLTNSAIETLTPELQMNLESKKCFVLAGNLGKAQDLLTVVEAAVLLKNNSDILILLVGDCSELPLVKSEIKRLGLQNLKSIGRVGPQVMGQIYLKFYATLLTLVDDSDLSLTLPWRAQTYLAYKKMVIGAINGEGSQVIRDASCGFVGPAGRAQALADNILKASHADEKQKINFEHNAYQYYLKHFEMDQQVRVLDGILNRLTS